MKAGRMLNPDYDAISDLLKENEDILGTERFYSPEMSTGKFRPVSSAYDPVTDDETDVFERVDAGPKVTVSGSADGRSAGAAAGMYATPTSETEVVEPVCPLPVTEEPETEAAEDSDSRFFPGIAQEKEAAPQVISFPIEDEVVDMMILTVDGIVDDAIELSDAESVGAVDTADADDVSDVFCACDGTVIDIGSVSEDVRMLSSPEQTAMISAPEETIRVGAPESLPALEAPASGMDAAEQQALMDAAVQVFTEEAVLRIAEEDRAEQDRMQHDLTDAAVQVFTEEAVLRIAEEDRAEQDRMQEELILIAVQVFTEETVMEIADEEALYVPEIRPTPVQPEIQDMKAAADVPVYAGGFMTSAEDVCSSDVAVQACASMTPDVAVQADEDDAAPVSSRTSVRFGFFGMPAQSASRASTVGFRFGGF